MKEGPGVIFRFTNDITKNADTYQNRILFL